MIELALAAFLLQWDPPTHNENGTPLEDLAGYEVHYGRESGVYDHSLTIEDPAATSLELTPPASGDWYVAMRAFDAEGDISQLSNEVLKTEEATELTLQAPDGSYVGWLATAETSTPVGWEYSGGSIEVQLVAYPDGTLPTTTWSGDGATIELEPTRAGLYRVQYREPVGSWQEAPFLVYVKLKAPTGGGID